MRLEGRIYRPPSEAASLLLQLTVGCSHNRCAFCAMYAEKKYRARPIADVLDDVDAAARHYPDTQRIFVCDGDALSSGYENFAALCERINERFPRLNRIAAYVNARDLLALKPEELAHLRTLRFSLAYLGLESGSAEVLEMIDKGATPEDMIAMVEHARQARIKTSVIALLGIGGRSLSKEHVTQTVQALNAMQPLYLSFLTTTIVPHTRLYAWAKQGRFHPLTDREILEELRAMMEGLELKGSVLRSNHVSNLVALEGRLPKNKATLLAQIDEALPFAQNDVSCVWTEAEGRFL